MTVECISILVVVVLSILRLYERFHEKYSCTPINQIFQAVVFGKKCVRSVAVGPDEEVKVKTVAVGRDDLKISPAIVKHFASIIRRKNTKGNQAGSQTCDADCQTQEKIITYSNFRRYYAQDVSIQEYPESRSIGIQAANEDGLMHYFVGVKAAFTNYIANSKKQVDALSQLFEDIHEFSLRQHPQFEFEGIRVWPNFEDPEHTYGGEYNRHTDTGDPPRRATCVQIEESFAARHREPPPTRFSRMFSSKDDFYYEAAITTRKLKDAVKQVEEDDWDDVPPPLEKHNPRGVKPDDFSVFPYGRGTRSVTAHLKRKAREKEKLLRKCSVTELS